MKTHRTNTTGLVVCAVFLGIMGDLLLRTGALGVNMTLYLLLTIGSLILLARRSGIMFESSARVSLAAATFFSVVYLWRDFGPTSVLILGVVSITFVLAVASRVGPDPRLAHLWDYVLHAVRFLVWAIRLPFVLASGTREVLKGAPRPESATVCAVLRGVLYASPLVIVFSALLMSADALFEQYFLNVFSFDIGNVAFHAGLIALCTWVASAILWQCLEGPVGDGVFPNQFDASPRYNPIETNVALGIVTALFLSFVCVQLRYLFGGHERVLTEVGLTYADYARRGFFELATVAGISLAVLVNCSRLVETGSVAGKRAYKVIAALFILSVVALIVSALHRMSLYIDSYGLTRLRLYTTVFMAWMIVVFAWLYLTIYRERIKQFAWGLVLTGYAATFFLLAINPDASISRINMARAAENKGLDLEYMGRLSADAIPPIVEGLDALGAEDERRARVFLENSKERFAGREYRTWTVGLTRAQSAMRALDQTGVSAVEMD